MNQVEARREMQRRHAARATMVAELLSEDEKIVESGRVNWVQGSEQYGRGGGEGILFVSTKGVLYAGEQNPHRLSIPFSAILTHRNKRIVIPGMRELQITPKSGKAMSFYAGKHFLGTVGYLLGQNETD